MEKVCSKGKKEVSMTIPASLPMIDPLLVLRAENLMKVQSLFKAFSVGPPPWSLEAPGLQRHLSSQKKGGRTNKTPRPGQRMSDLGFFSFSIALQTEKAVEQGLAPRGSRRRHAGSVL